MADRAFSCTCIVSVCFFASWSCDSSACNSKFLVRFSYVWDLRLLSYFHSRARNFSLSTALRAIASLRSLTSCGVSGTMCSSKYMMHCCSCWTTSLSCATYCGTRSSVFTSTTVIERSALLTISFTLSCSASNCSLLCCSCAFSSSHFTWREIFSCFAVMCCSRRTPCTCAKAWVACAVSSRARLRQASIVSKVRWS
jgi:hypothetical protein